MKGVVLAGGLGTRLYPLTFATNKHLLPVYDKPMVFYPLSTLVNAGIDEILIVVGGPHASHFMQVIRNGKDLGIKHLEFAYQEKEGGIADALLLAENFAEKEPIAVILGDNTTDTDISGYVKDFKDGALLFLKQVPDAHRFGIAVFNVNNPKKIEKIIEKPTTASTNFAVTGLYMYDKQVFDIIRQIQPSQRGELEITDVNNSYIAKSQMRWVELQGFWSDAGTFKSLYSANKYYAEKEIKK